MCRIGMKGGKVFVGRGKWEVFVCCDLRGLGSCVWYFWSHWITSIFYLFNPYLGLSKKIYLTFTINLTILGDDSALEEAKNARSKEIPASVKSPKSRARKSSESSSVDDAKGQLISECLFDFFKFSKKPTKNLTNFCPRN